jgi:thioredoxin 2
MNPDSIIVKCPKCGAQNRIPREKTHEHPRCGRCHEPLPENSFDFRPPEVSDRTFAQKVLSSADPVLVFCYSPQCAYCLLASPVVDELALKYEGRIHVARLRVDENPAIARQYGIQGVPTLLLFRNGKLLHRMVGLVTKEDMERNLMPYLRGL